MSTEVGAADRNLRPGCARDEENPALGFGQMFLQESERRRRFVIDRVFTTAYNSRRHVSVTRRSVSGVEAGLRRTSPGPDHANGVHAMAAKTTKTKAKAKPAKKASPKAKKGAK
jgi:hypothetical protein